MWSVGSRRQGPLRSQPGTQHTHTGVRNQKQRHHTHTRINQAREMGFEGLRAAPLLAELSAQCMCTHVSSGLLMLRCDVRLKKACSHLDGTHEHCNISNPHVTHRLATVHPCPDCASKEPWSPPASTFIAAATIISACVAFSGYICTHRCEQQQERRKQYRVLISCYGTATSTGLGCLL